MSEKKGKASESGQDIVGAGTQLEFACAVCNKLYKHPGMCKTCHVLLKPSGE